MRALIYLPGARRDFLEAFSYYDNLPIKYGRRFEEAYRKAAAEIKTGIVTHRTTFGSYHRVLVPKFPYAVYYRLEGPDAVIVGILGLKQDPRVIEFLLGSR